MVDQQKALNLISSRDHCQRFSPSQISNTLRVQEWSCAVFCWMKLCSTFPPWFNLNYLRLVSNASIYLTYKTCIFLFVLFMFSAIIISVLFDDLFSSWKFSLWWSRICIISVFSLFISFIYMSCQTIYDLWSQDIRRF